MATAVSYNPESLAMQWDGTELNKQEIYAWVAETLLSYDISNNNPPPNGVTFTDNGDLMIVQNRQGMVVCATDYVVKYPNDSFRVIYYEHFERDYSQAPE
jgi:hypothetical protein